MLDELRQRMGEPVDAASLVFLRIAFGTLMFVELVRYLAFGWAHDYWIAPDFHFKYFGFEWVPAFGPTGMYVLFGVLLLTSALIAVGLFYRAAAALFTLGFTYLFLVDQAPYLNHFYFVILLGVLMTVVPAHVDASVDAHRRPELRSRTVPAWSVWILRFQMGVVYFYGGIAKLNEDWLAGQPLTMWLRDNEALPAFMQVPEVGLVMSWAGAALDLWIVPLLLWKRTRLLGFVLIVSFHLINAWIFSIGIFPWLSIAVTTIFFAPDHRFFKRVVGWLRVAGPPPPPAAAPPPSSLRSMEGDDVASRPAPPTSAAQWGEAEERSDEEGGAGTSAALFLFLVLWVAVQLFVPLRHWLYPGSVHWNEEGHRFAWHMKLRSKTATGSFFVVDETTQERIKIDDAEHLARHQMYKMRSRPDMILQYAHYLADEYADRGPIRVHAHLFVSLNGRRLQRFVDPEVDLSKQKRTLGHVEWILGLEADPRR